MFQYNEKRNTQFVVSPLIMIRVPLGIFFSHATLHDESKARDFMFSSPLPCVGLSGSPIPSSYIIIRRASINSNRINMF